MSESHKEKLALVLIAYWATILAARSFIFYYGNKNLAAPLIIIGGFHIYHFIIGLFLILIFGGLFHLLGLQRSFFSLAFLGIGLGLLFDELSFLFSLRFNDYWGVRNFLAIVVLGFPLSLILFWPKKKRIEAELVPKRMFNRKSGRHFISIVIPAFNEEKFLARSLQSLASQSYQDFELIVVDNNSRDKTREIAESFGAKVIFEPKRGVGHARQTGFRAAQGEIIATTDADTVLPRDWLERIVFEFKKDKNLVAFGGLYILDSGTFPAKLGVYYFLYPIWLWDKLISGGWSLTGSNFAVRKKVFLKVGGFTMGMKLGEDIHIARKLRAIGDVKFDPHFRVRTSGRRYKDGLLRALFTYAPSHIASTVFARERFHHHFPTIRTETSLLQRSFFLSLLFATLFLSFLFYFSNPLISEAKGVKLIKQGVASPVREVKKNSEELKSFVIKAKKGIKSGKRLQYYKIWKLQKLSRLKSF